MYSFLQMRDDLRADVQRYVGLFWPAPAGRSPNLLRVLLTFPGLAVLAAYRTTFWLHGRYDWKVNRFAQYLLNYLNQATAFWCVIFMKTQFSWWPAIGPGLYLSNRGGIIIGARRIGANCVIHHNVTVGIDRDRQRPEIGSRVWIGPDTVIYGNVKIGDGVVVRGSTVLGKSIPDRCLVEGNPGRIVKRNVDNSAYLLSDDPYFSV